MLTPNPLFPSAAVPAALVPMKLPWTTLAVVAGLLTPDITPIHLPGLTEPSEPADLLPILWRNSLVLALHATACVAGFIAGADVNAFRGATDPQAIEITIGRAHAVVDRLEALRVPVPAGPIDKW